ncbi:23524_t:CDS:2 [Gigaspora margarita]|uniref:23524_t:CDS:1 n=1 Tax=Gigaspora margarita TaxID=4874 RepID=A0ABN7WKX8_GIGMA|nr:23524_t:CDS:2 [Gigaspora margarita]
MKSKTSSIRQKLWKKAHEYMKLREEVVTVHNVKNPRNKEFMLWLRINVVYEIWFWCINEKWGKSPLPEPDKIVHRKRKSHEQ